MHHDDRANDVEKPHPTTWNAFDEVVVDENVGVDERTSASDVVEDTCV